MLKQPVAKLAGISPVSWEHPADKAALRLLKQTGGLGDIIKMIVGGTMERSIRLLHVASSVKVGSNQFPRIKGLIDKAAEVLDSPSVPDVFVVNDPRFNAGAAGVKEPFIVVHSALVGTLDDDELYCALAHELGHILSGHSVYKTVLWVLLRISLSAVPIAGLLIKPLVLALREWDRKSELTADRAALLASQSEQPNYNLLMKTAGGSDLSQMNANDFFQQAWEYENQKGLLDSIFKILNTAWESHPFAVVRLQELRSWAASGAYQAILDGAYVRRGSEKGDASRDTSEAYQYYKTTLDQSDDPVLKAVRGVGSALGEATKGVRDAIKDIFKNP